MDRDRDPSPASGPVEARPGTSTQEMTLNMGPQHPSTPCVLRMVLTFEAERIIG